MKEYNKLVRDRIPEIIEKSGAKAITRTLTDEEFKVFLEKKLDEEVKEFHESKSLEELADILEVVFSLSAVYGNAEEMLEKWLKKAATRGNFKQKILLISVEEGANND